MLYSLKRRAERLLTGKKRASAECWKPSGKHDFEWNPECQKDEKGKYPKPEAKLPGLVPAGESYLPKPKRYTITQDGRIVIQGGKRTYTKRQTRKNKRDGRKKV
ncbi:MAG: hypothetical protein EBT86_06585, partial [Actinobacteria bacterium]|nr:hypothetical protein [Actinomycetota bacterium]